MKNRCLGNTNAPLPQHIENRLDLWPLSFTYWPEYWWRLSTHAGLSTYQVWSFWGKAFLSYQLHKVWGDWHDLWPTDLNIKRDHLLIKDYVPTKFEASGAKSSWAISCTRCWKPAWLLTLTFDLLTWIPIGTRILTKPGRAPQGIV